MIIKKEVKRSGGSGAVFIPAKYIGKEAMITIEEEGMDYLTRSQIEVLVEEKIQEAKQGY